MPKRVRDTQFYRKANLPLIQSVKKDIFPIDWNLDENKHPRILVQPADFSGCGHYRLIYPLLHMIKNNGIQGLAINRIFKTHEMARFNPDTVVFQRQVSDEMVKYTERTAHINQAFVITELDDLLDGIQDNNIHSKDFNTRHFNNLYKVLHMSDRFVCSTEFIKNWYSKYIDDIVVMENRLNKDIWLPLEYKRGTSDKLRIGWAGGHSHTGDLAIIVDTVKELHKEVDFVFFGYMHPEVERYVKEFHPGSSFKDYPGKIASLNLDIALTPLEDVPFNHAKSHLKVLEFGILGCPIIATNITPYKGFPVVYPKTNDSKGFTDAIRELMSDMDSTYKMGDTLKQHIIDNWMLDDYYNEWQKAWTPS